MKPRSFSAASVHAPVFVPKAKSSTSSPMLGSLETPNASPGPDHQPSDASMGDGLDSRGSLNGTTTGLAFTRSADAILELHRGGDLSVQASLSRKKNTRRKTGTIAARDEQPLCKNIVTHGRCIFQNRGCRFYHPPTRTVTEPLSRSSSLASAIHAPIFVPKSASVENSPSQPWLDYTEDSQESSFANWDSGSSSILSVQDSEMSFGESDMDEFRDFQDHAREEVKHSMKILELFYRILLRKASRNALQTLQGAEAQVIIDYLYSVLLWPELQVPSLRKHALISLYRLCKASLLYPHCYILNDSFESCSHEGGGAFSDIWKGTLGHKEFCLKVVRMHQKSDTDNLLKICLVSPWMRNGNVVEYLKQHADVSRAPFISDVAAGLDYLHSQDIVHGDLKGVNILVNDLEKGCITDFGLSIVRTDKTFAYTLASSNPNGFSIRWAAPELLEPDDGAQVTLASDVWAFGCVSYEIMTGLLPFYDLSEVQTMHALTKGKVPARPSTSIHTNDVENAIWALVYQCCQVNPHQRLSASQVLSELRLAGLTGDSTDSFGSQVDAMQERQLFWEAMRRSEDSQVDLRLVEHIFSNLDQDSGGSRCYSTVESLRLLKWTAYTFSADGREIALSGRWQGKRDLLPLSLTMSILPNARNLHISKSHFINVVNPEHTDRSGLNKLLKHSIMVASHDSSARWLPPQCHLGTREDYIAALTEWGSKPEVNLLETIIWVNGPAGVGKSAIAQSVADALGELLGCSFFFSRPNGRDDPNTFFTTLSYQLAVRFPDSGYSEIVNETIRRDPSIVEKAIPDQFRHLFVIPLQKLRIDEKLLSPKVIIVDGLDECRSEGAHLTIISTIIKSVRAMSTPFTWLTLSRLEPHIVAAFSSSLAIPVTRHMELTISPSLNPQIRLFFTEKLTEIWTNKAIASSWPAAEDITALVNFSAGLFAHSHALVLFIDDPDSEGPQHQLCAVLSLADEIKQAGEKHPLAALDFFYDVLVLKQIPEAKRTSIRIMLLVYRMGLMISNQDVGVDTKIVANVLGKQDDQPLSLQVYLV
ncbi:hypothetical protein NP233_g12919 [Leucocoprinus birnbaumii]|uniref:Uncharacterized protein n=1 Tax=Leucocoprinus birnbaumii TaxID=56174 RepID=A0AAD5VG15_9AGAR|nr:hypothetical protein NP233_g12919 [Leucocoprinus birnbaumii]